MAFTSALPELAAGTIGESETCKCCIPRDTVNLTAADGKMLPSEEKPGRLVRGLPLQDLNGGIVLKSATTNLILNNNRLLERLIAEVSDLKGMLARPGTVPSDCNGAPPAFAHAQQSLNGVTHPSSGSASDIERILQSMDLVDERIMRLESRKYDDTFKGYANGPAVLNLNGPEKFLLGQLRETKRILSSKLPTCV